jgi:17 kDa outer membrane surface antigen
MSKACCRAAALLLFAASLSACATHGIESATADIVDQGTQTGSLPAGPETPDPTRVSDETTIRNAVSSADPEQAKVEPLAWANAETGSRGSISEMLEKEEGGVLCRQFKASRESFDGVALYEGDACKGDRGVWYLRDFKPL